MEASIPETMRAAVIDRYGGPEVLHLGTLPVPEPERNQVLIRVDTAGIGVWDPYLRTGELDTGRRDFPQVIGNDGAGTVAAVGKGVTRFRPGDRVYAYDMSGGFYAEYVVVDEENVAKIPRGVELDEAGALGADGITALRGLEDELHVGPGTKLMILGASGGIGHLAVQLAKRKRAAVLAVASGADGVDLTRRLGADASVDGHALEAVAVAARLFAPDAALVLAYSDGLRDALAAVKRGGRIAFPNGVEPEPEAPKGVGRRSYDGTPSAEAFERLNRLIEPGPFHVELGRVYRLEEASQAHRDIEKHHLGKRAFLVRAS